MKREIRRTEFVDDASAAVFNTDVGTAGVVLMLPRAASSTSVPDTQPQNLSCVFSDDYARN